MIQSQLKIFQKKFLKWKFILFLVMCILVTNWKEVTLKKLFWWFNCNFKKKSKYDFFHFFFTWLNVAISQKVKKIFEILFFHVIIQINCDILPMISFEFGKFEKLDLYHLSAHSAEVEAGLTGLENIWYKFDIIYLCTNNN